MGCPMGFGELNIPSSRAFWDDCDEDECPQKEVEKLLFKYETSEEDVLQYVKKAKRMFVIEGLSVAQFAEASLLKNAKKLANIPSKKSSLHYVEAKELLVAIVEEDLTNSGEICELLLNLGKPEEVITLTVKPKFDYKSENISAIRDEITFLRSIEGKLNNIEALEAPNFIVGVGAGICSWRSNEGLKVQSYVAYTDNIALDSLAAKPIVKLLNDLDIECLDTYNPKKRDDSHLYM
ncbi:proteasome assembly chaperone 1 [Cochliomyia hominivorax]